MEKQIKQRVARGIKWLDKNHPNWYKKIDLGKFDIECSDVCVCGQVFKDMMNGFFSGFDYFERTYSNRFAVSLGFTMADDATDYQEHWDILGSLWVKEIRRRQKVK